MALLMKLVQYKKNTTQKKTLAKLQSKPEAYDLESTIAEIKVEPNEGNSKVICRVCLKGGSIPIFAGEEKESELSRQLNLFGGINVQWNDVHTKYLCKLCHTNLQVAILFRKSAQKSDLYLQRKYMRSEANKKVEVEIDFSDYKEVSVKKEKNIVNKDDSKEENGHMVSETEGDIKEEIIIIHLEMEGDCKEENRNIHSESEAESKKETRDIRSERSDSKEEKGNIHSETESSLQQLHNNEQFGNKFKSREYNCSLCNIKFVSRNECVQHNKDKHSNKRVACTICHQKYTTVYLATHMKTHLTESPHVCDICGKTFKLAITLRNHRASHFLELPVQCSLCPYRGRSKHALRCHMRSHSEDKPYQCLHCPRKFSRNSNMNTHMLSHKTEFDFKCEQCDRGFHSKTRLDAHVKVIHMGIKDHSCETCGKQFGCRQKMMRHMFRIHKRQKNKGGPVPLYLMAEKDVDATKRLN